MEPSLIRIELGCGKTKMDGYVGIDRYPMPGVDIIADLNKKLPLENDYADIIFASHSLEHLDDMQHIISEIYRIGKHKSIVYILSPYASTSLNIANFYHKLQFNEDTFRLFSNEKDCLIDKEEYYCPHSYDWGIEQSDNSQGTIELKLVKMEYFYYKEYVHLSDIEKLHARKALSNVCDQIFYALIINKSNSQFTEEEIEELIDNVNKYEPPVINSLRYRDAQQLESTSLITDIKNYSEQYVNNQVGDLETEFIELMKDKEIKFLEDISYLKNIYTDNSAKIEEQNHILVKQSDYIELLMEKINNLEIYVKKAREQSSRNSSSMNSILLDLLMIHDKGNIFSFFYFYTKKRDMFNNLRLLHTDFIDGIIIQNQILNQSSRFIVSKVIPYSGYVEYNVLGNGSLIHFFLFANYGSNLFIELVMDGNIVYQKNYTIEDEGEQIINLEGIKGEILIRFKTLDNKSIVRVLELVNRKKMFFTKRFLAAYIE